MFEQNIVSRLVSGLEFDEGLLIGPKEVQFEKEGVLFGQSYLAYSKSIRNYNLGLSRGFLDRLLEYRSSAKPGLFGISVDLDLVLDRRYYHRTFTLAFIRGPKGLSLDLLRSRRFPEYPSGTVSEYHRLINDPGKDILFQVEKLQVMWSYRAGVKSVQLEELVPMHSRLFANADYIANRYVHARWNVEGEFFEHFDGAVRVYKKENYQKRLAVDIRAADRADDYLKQFRVDGAILLADWCDLTSRYFYGNELVEEYFDPATE